MARAPLGEGSIQPTTATPNWSTSAWRTAAARLSDRAWYAAAAPTLSVWPSISSFSSGCSDSIAAISFRVGVDSGRMRSEPVSK